MMNEFMFIFGWDTLTNDHGNEEIFFKKKWILLVLFKENV